MGFSNLPGNLIGEAEIQMTLSRREMLKLSGCLAASTLLTGCNTPEDSIIIDQEISEDPGTRSVTNQVLVLYYLNEFTYDHIAQFHAENPGITIEIANAGTSDALYVMYAAGTPPDICRVQAPVFPGLLARGLIQDLTPYFEASNQIDITDLAPANNYYRAESPLEIGKGRIYGMVKDFSPDFTIFANAALFEAAGLGTPDDSRALSYDEIMSAAEKLTIFNGEQRIQYGFGYEFRNIDRIWMNILAETGQILFTKDYSTLNISSNEDALEIVRWFYDMAVEKLSPSSRNPSPTGSFITDFPSNMAAMALCGYWYSPMLISEDNKGSAMMLPGPTWTGVRRNPAVTATGSVITSASQQLNAAWKIYEYFHAGPPSIERAVNGWGVPAFRSRLDLLPQETGFQRQICKVLKAELALNTPPLQFNPYLNDLALPELWNKYLDQALVGDIKFDEMIAGIEFEANVMIKDSIDRLAS